MELRLCSYVVVVDKGFAPNPFHGYCTLAACTPNHVGVKLERGDWLLGNTTKDKGNRLLYAMRVSEVMDLDDYFHGPRFQPKKPGRGAAWEDRCGDNIYHRVLDGWAQAFTYHHRGPGRLEQDTKHPRVFISDHFYYFGENAVEIPAELAELIKTRQGVKYSGSPEVAGAFVTWLEASYAPGLNGAPRDREIRPGDVDRPVQPKPRTKARDRC